MGDREHWRSLSGSEDYDADTVERYGWINSAIPDAELDDFVDRFARRISSFDKEALTESKRLFNRASRLSDNEQLVDAGTSFVKMLTRHDTQARISKLMSRDLHHTY